MAQPFKQREIDGFAYQYEEFRSVEPAGPGSVQQFLQALGLTALTCPQLVSELIQVDIELAWMSWDKQLLGSHDMPSPTAVLARFNQLPRLRDYAALIDSADSSQQRDVAQSELVARDTCGDAIGQLYYQLEYGLRLSSYRYHEPNMVRCDMDGAGHAGHRSQNAGFMLRGRTVIGRQRSSDTEHSFVEKLNHGNRIVIANRKEAKISREHLVVQLLTPSYAIITNVSKINAIVLASSAVIDPGDSRLVEFPFTVTLPGRRLYFYRSSKAVA